MRPEAYLRRGQHKVIDRIYEHNASLVVVGMGGGKTASGLTAITSLIDDGHIRGALALAPKRVAQLVWTKEPEEWEHLAGMPLVHVAGSPAERARLLRQDAEVWVVSLDNVGWLLEELESFPAGHPIFDMLLVDEISRFKNPRSKRLRALRKFSETREDRWGIRVGLTGTPRPNGYEDLWGPLTLLSRAKIWGRSFDKWRQERFYPTDYNAYRWAIKPEWEERTRAEAARYSVTLGPEDLADIPTVTTVTHWYDLSPDDRADYKQMERKLLAPLKNGDTVLAANQAVATGKLAQMVQGFIYDEAGAAHFVNKDKIDILGGLVEAAGGEPLMIAYGFKEDLNRLKMMFKDFHWFGEGTSDRAAAENERLWNAGQLDALGLHPASAGHGLNLQFGGSQIVWYCPTFSAELYDQTIHRFARPGQLKPCYSHLILARDTVDCIKYYRVVEKMNEQEAFQRYLLDQGY